MFKKIVVFICIFSVPVAHAQINASYKEYPKKYLTYSFSDPDPIPPLQKIYPYFRFDGFTTKGEEKEWTVVELENDYVSVQIMPEIGGKVWTAMDKKSGKHFFYNNEVVKFRDIAMRGPWVSGGIEANYGIIGHTPNSATPVDYLVQNNDDGSVSCITSTLDLLTRTRWVLEIKLEKDKAYFTTQSYWFNSSGLEMPYYTWMNAGIPAGEDLKFLYPGHFSIGHGGESREWPLDQKGRDLSFYAQNNFGGSKSYHITGTHSNYFGALWEDQDFGMIHYSKREDKLGKKIFLWAQSEEGRIWEELLTDDSGQYVEIQSGRLFNQNDFQSSSTPFKQIGFSPYSSDTWTEYWYPFQGMGGFTSANLLGAFHIESSRNSMSVKISAVQPIQDSLKVLDKDGKIIVAKLIQANPLDNREIKLLLPANQTPAQIELQGHILDLREGDMENRLNRPVEIAEGINEVGAYGLYLQGRDLSRFRNYQMAEEKISASLQEDPYFLPALVEMAKLKLFRLDFDSAFHYSLKALSIDTYDGEANYYYGKAAFQLGQDYDAMDGFEVAALTPQFRNAAFTELSHLYLKRNDRKKSKDYAQKALDSNPQNMDALQVLFLIARINRDKKSIEETKGKIKELNPLNHFIRFEAYLDSPSEDTKSNFSGLIRNEMPVETYLELAIWYANLGLEEESREVLGLAPSNSETHYWLAWLNRETDPIRSRRFLRAAEESPAYFVFPFRQETSKVMEWAGRETQAWQPDYFLALIMEFRGNIQQARILLNSHTERIDFAPFYISRARLNKEESAEDSLKDISTASQIDPQEWRYGRILAETLVHAGKYQEAIEILEKQIKADSENYILGMDLTRAYMLSDNYSQAEKILNDLHVLPFEGATGARRYHRETKLMLAHQAIDKERYSEALEKIEEAEEWPKRLGVGQPFPGMINNDLENWMRAMVYQKMGKSDLHHKFSNLVKNQDFKESSYVKLIKAINSRSDRRMF